MLTSTVSFRVVGGTWLFSHPARTESARRVYFLLPFSVGIFSAITPVMSCRESRRWVGWGGVFCRFDLQGLPASPLSIVFGAFSVASFHGAS